MGEAGGGPWDHAAGPQVWGQRRAGTQAWEVGPLHPHPAPPGQETPQHHVNRRDFPSPQGEAGARAGSQWGSGPRRVQVLPTCLVLRPEMGRGHLLGEGRRQASRKAAWSSSTSPHQAHYTLHISVLPPTPLLTARHPDFQAGYSRRSQPSCGVGAPGSG